MRDSAHRARPRPLLLSPDAWAVAEKLAEAAGVSPAVAIELILLDMRRELDVPAPESSPLPAAPNVIPISRGRRGRRRPSGPP